jgi:excisionase family DNA binding protein
MNNPNLDDDTISTSGSVLGDSVTDHTTPLWTVDDVASYLKLQPETIRSMARRGELPAIKLGKVWRFQKTAIHEMLASMS